MEFNLASYLFLGSVPIIVGFVQVFKSWIKDERWYPVIAIILGIAINVGLATVTGVDYVSALVMGGIAGLSSSGLYSIATVGK